MEHEPRFEMWMEPTPLQCFAGRLWHHALRIPIALLPHRWSNSSRKGTWRYEFIYWFLIRSYWAYERAEGRA